MPASRSVPVGEGANGRITRKGRTVCTRAEAETLVAELKTAKNDRTAVPASKLTVAQWADEWLDGLVYPRRRTVADYEHVMRVYVKPLLGTRRLQSLTTVDVARMVEHLGRPKADGGRGLAPRTVSKVLAVLHRALAKAVARRLLPSNPASIDKDDRPKRQRIERVWLDADAARVFIDAVDGHKKEALWLTLLLTGARPGEVLGLRWGDLRGDELSIQRALVSRGDDTRKLLEPKTATSRRSVPLPKGLVAALERHRKAQAKDRLRAGSAWSDDDLIFCDAIGRPLRQDALRKPFKTILRNAKLPDMRLYDVRHSQASLLLAYGVPAKVVAERLGHVGVGLTLDTYSHVSSTLQRTAVDHLDKLLG